MHHLPGLLTFLAVDAGGSFQMVHRSDADHWGVSLEEAFSIAIANSMQRAEPEPGSIGSPAGGPEIHPFPSATAHSAALALDAQFLSTNGGPVGTLFILPSPSDLLVAGLDTAESLANLGPLKHLAESIFAQAPHAISPDVFWFHEGVYERVDLEPTDGRLKFTPSPRMRAALGL